jgi:hypothetical protein
LHSWALLDLLRKMLGHFGGELALEAAFCEA